RWGWLTHCGAHHGFMVSFSSSASMSGKLPLQSIQNGYCERAIGSIRRDCLDHVVVVGERHLRHLLRSCPTYYNQPRTHLSVNKDAPSPRTIHAVGRIVKTPFLGGLLPDTAFRIPAPRFSIEEEAIILTLER